MAMLARDVMTPDPACCSPNATLENVAQMMVHNDCGEIPVVDPTGHPVGVITDRDIAIRAVAEGKSPDTPVREIMSQELLYCFDDQELEEVARNMADIKVRRLPVLNRDKRLVGIVSLGDLSQKEQPEVTAKVVSNISKPGGKHSQAVQ